MSFTKNLLVMLAACCFSVIANSQSLEERVRAIDDEREIRSLMVMYGKHLDALQLTEFSQLFAREGSWAGSSSNFVPVKGPANIKAMLEKSYEGRVYDPKRVSNVHVMSNAAITVKGDRASGYSKWTVMTRNDKDEPFVRHLGHYDDEYIREDGRWKFLTRVVHRDIP
jgi:hypothetical protein